MADYTTTDTLLQQLWSLNESIDSGKLSGLAAQTARAETKALEDELTRRHNACECDVCGYGPKECICEGNAQGHDVVLTNELECDPWLS